MQKSEYRNAIRSKQLIKTALAELLHEKPLDKITVTDVVRRADINRSTFYAHYKDIPDVLNHIADGAFEKIREIFLRERKTEDAPDIILREVQMLIEKESDFYKIIMTSGASAMLQERIAEIVTNYLIGSKEISSSGKKTVDEANLIFCTGGLIRLYRNWFEGKLEITIDELTSKATELITRIINKQE